MTDRDLRAKYGAAACDAGQRLQPASFAERLALRDSLDQHYTKLWLDFTVNGLMQRPALDARTRFLVLTGQFTMTRSHRHLDDTIRAALDAGVKAREILEIILQCTIYGGDTVADPAIEIFHAIAAARGLLEELRATQLPLDGRDRERDYATEEKTWSAEDKADPRFAALKEKHGWLGVGRGLTMRPRHHLNTLSWQDAIDSDWAGLWVDFTYQGMYGRGIVDDRTRLLCMVGNCVAVGEATEGRAHMRGALRAGANPREVLEVILQSCSSFGMPQGIHALKQFVKIMEEDGRLGEIGNPPPRVDAG